MLVVLLGKRAFVQQVCTLLNVILGFCTLSHYHVHIEVQELKRVKQHQHDKQLSKINS
jgi:hypothetical protein